MSITIPDSPNYKPVEDEIERHAEYERRSKTQMAIILLEEALKARSIK